MSATRPDTLVLQPLMEAGLDSLGAVELRNQLATAFPSIELPATLIFDHPSVAAISQFIESRHQPVQIHIDAHLNKAGVRAGRGSGDIEEQVLGIIEGMLGTAVHQDQVSL